MHGTRLASPPAGGIHGTQQGRRRRQLPGTKDYNERTRKFVDSGKVEDAARDAEPKSEEEKHAMQKAERIGRSHAKK